MNIIRCRIFCQGVRTIVGIVERLDDTAVFLREGRSIGLVGSILGIRALHGNQHGLGALAEVVGLHEDRRTCAGAGTILGKAVVIVVVHVNRHGANTSMTRVRVVEPIVVIGNPVLAALALHTAHSRLTGIPEVAVSDGDVLGVRLHVNGTVALLLVATLVGTIESINVMYPDVVVVGIQRDIVIHTRCHAEVAKLNRSCVANQEAEAVNEGVVANTLKSHVQLAVLGLTLNLQALGRRVKAIHVAGLDSADETYTERTLLLSFLIGSNDSLQTSE